MPRGSSAKRQQGVANTRDTRHENGLVGPGKRIVKQKSRNEIHLDGSPRPHLNSQSLLSADSAAPPPIPCPLPSTANANANANGNGNGNGYAKHNLTSSDDIMSDNLRPRRPSLAAYSETSSESLSVSPNQAATEEPPRRIDVNAAKNINVHRDTGPLDFAFTVLRSCPLHDTIAILIILMQLSPFALSSIYTLFTLLTFVPPPTTSSGLSVTEIFDGFGAPNLWTLVGLDLFFLIIFAFMPQQDLILDFAQVVIAMTLGGGASSRAGTTHNIVLCLGFVLFNHFGNHQILSRYTNLKSLFGTVWGTPDTDDYLNTVSRAYARKSPRGLFKSVLAIHILVQGLVRYVRDWYLRREKRDLLSQSQSDPEAGKTTTLGADPTADGAYAPTDTENHKQGSSSIISTKKRRKQSHQVRLRQPLWAALASTKIVMVKEYELSHAASESAGSNATDIHNLGNAPFNTQPEQIWICYVGCDEVCFNTSHFPDKPSLEGNADSDDGSGPSYIDANKPFYVRVNKAAWQPTRIIPVDHGEEDRTTGTRWTGDIFGLTPMSNYECEFVSTRTGEVIFSTSIRTIPAKTKDADAAKAGATRSQYRHESPATTLRTSISVQEAKLNEEKARLKGLRKDNNRKTNSVKKEIDRLTAAVQSAGGNDEKLRQKIAQNTTQQKQAEQTLGELQEQLKEFGTIPEALMIEYRKKQGEYNSDKARFDKARAAFKEFKASFEQKTKALEDDQNTLGTKRTKIATRLNKVDGEHARIMDANARGLDEAQRRQQETDSFVADVQTTIKVYDSRYANAKALNEEKQQTAGNMANTLDSILQQTLNQTDHAAFYERQDVGAYNAAAALQWPQYAQNAMWSPSPAAALPATTLAGNTPVNPMYAHSAFSQFQLSGIPSLRQKSRGRSSSMLSDISGFTQSTNDEDEARNSNNSNNASNGNLNASVAGNSSINANAPPFLPPIQTQSHSENPSPFGQYSYLAGGMRSPPGFPPFPQGGIVRKASGSGSGFAGSGSASGSVGSFHSGSESSVGSNKDPASPV